MTASRITVIASVQLLGGLALLIGYALTAVTARTGFADWQFFLGALFGVFSCVAAVRLHRGLPNGVQLSMIVQAIQILAITVVPSLRFVAVAGIKLRIILASTGFYWQVGFGGEFIAVPFARDGSLGALGSELSIFGAVAPRPLEQSSLTVAVNLAALYFLIVLYKRARRVVESVDATSTSVDRTV